MKDGREIVYVDMDDTLCDFIGPFKTSEFKLKYPQSKVGFFLDLDPIEGAIEGVKTLQTKYDVWILTRPSIKNTNCYTEKAEWIKNDCAKNELLKTDIFNDYDIIIILKRCAE